MTCGISFQPGSLRIFKDSHLNLASDMLLRVAREFMLDMAQPCDKMAVGKSLLTQMEVDRLATSEPTNKMID